MYLRIINNFLANFDVLDGFSPVVSCLMPAAIK
jgi:hypothetical protein